MIEEVLPGYDEGLEAAATHLEHLSITAPIKDRDGYLFMAHQIRLLKYVDDRSDNPYRHTMAVMKVDHRETNIIPLPPAPDGFIWRVIIRDTIWAVCYQEGKDRLTDNLKAALFGFNPNGGLEDALNLPLEVLNRYGIHQVLVLDPYQLKDPPLPIEGLHWRYLLHEELINQE